MAWTQSSRDKAVRKKRQKAEIRDGEIRAVKRARPYLTLQSLACQFGVSHMTIKRALDKQLTLDVEGETP